MDTAPTSHGPESAEAESPAERQARLAWEEQCIQEALASVAAGRVIPFERVEAWIESIGTPNELPPPRWDD